jgi:hypothetical protein
VESEGKLFGIEKMEMKKGDCFGIEKMDIGEGRKRSGC